MSNNALCAISNTAWAVLIGLIIILIFVGLWVKHRLAEKARIAAFINERTALKMEQIDNNKVAFYTEFDIANSGKRNEAMVLDAFGRSEMPKEQYDKARLSVRLERATDRRDDGYMEAFAFFDGPREKMIYTFTVESPSQSILQTIEEIKDIKLALYIHSVGRDDGFIRRWYFIATQEEMKKALNDAGVYTNARVC